MLQDQLQLVCRASDILLDPQMEGLASSDPTAGRGMNRSKPTATMAMMNQDQRPSAAAAPQQALKCPRCDSTNTKFCYYNNYSQTQPRHFCKSCRRYWTQGGSLRNVPVGGGCRKNKRVKPRSLMNLSSGQYGGHGGLLDPSSLLFDDSSTSHMLARLSNISSSLMGAPNYNGEDQLLNIAFSRFQESCMRHSQLQTDSETSPEGGTVVPYFDMGYPSLVQKPACPSTFDNHLACLTSTPESDTAYRNPNSFGVNPNFHNMDVGTSATATLASIEDQLSTFSNLQQPHHAAHEQPFHAETHTARDDKTCVFGNTPERSPLQLLLAHGASSHHSASVPTDQERHSINTELCDDPNWQQPTFMLNEMSLEAHNHHSHNLTSSLRWQDMMQSLYSNTTAATTAGSVL